MPKRQREVIKNVQSDIATGNAEKRYFPNVVEATTVHQMDTPMRDIASLGGGRSYGRPFRGMRPSKALGRKLISQALRERAAHPSGTYGKAYFRRGVPGSVGMDLFGATYGAASPQQKMNRKAFGYRGRGGYWGGWLGQKLGIGSAAGSAIGDAVGNLVRSHVPYGQRIMSAYNTLTGQGDYTAAGAGPVETAVANAIVSAPNVVHSAVPMFAPQGDGSIVISRREPVTDVFGPSAAQANFSVQRLALNPGIEATFPWLSQIAQNYTEYEFKQLAFTFESTLSALQNTTGQSGQALLATQYNPLEGPFQSKMQMDQYALVSRGEVTQNIIHGVECDPALLSGTPGKYVRSGAWAATDGDLSDFDHGNLNLALCSMNTGLANVQVGQLWVTYTVVLRKPRLFTSQALGLGRDAFLAVSPNQWQSPFDTTTSFASSGGKAPPVVYRGARNNIGCYFNFNGTQLLFPPGYTGTVSVRITLARMRRSGTDTTIISASAPLAPGSDAGVSSADYTNPGVIPISDIVWSTDFTQSGANLGGSDYLTSSQRLQYSQSFAGSYTIGSILEGHFRITNPGIGKVNAIVWNTGFVNTNSIDKEPDLAFIEVTEYNPALQPSGGVQQFVDPSGNVLVLPTAVDLPNPA